MNNDNFSNLTTTISTEDGDEIFIALLNRIVLHVPITQETVATAQTVADYMREHIDELQNCMAALTAQEQLLKSMHHRLTGNIATFHKAKRK